MSNEDEYTFNDNTLFEAGIDDEPEVIDPDLFDEGDENTEFDFVDGIDVPDPSNDHETEEVSLDEFPDDEDDENDGEWGL